MDSHNDDELREHDEALEEAWIHDGCFLCFALALLCHTVHLQGDC